GKVAFMGREQVQLDRVTPRPGQRAGQLQAKIALALQREHGTSNNKWPGEHIRSRERRRFDRQSVARPPRSAGVNPAPQKRIGTVTLWGRLYAGQRYFDRHSRGVPALVGRGKPGPTKRIGAMVLWG